MAKKKFSIEFEGLDELMKDFERLNTDIKPVAEKALVATHEYITPQLHEKMQKSNLPAKGLYSTGDSEKQIIDEAAIEWEGPIGKMPIGFSLDEGITPIFLIYGTPDMPAVKGLKSTLYGTKTKEEVSKIQEKIFTEELEKVMNGGK